MSKNIQIKLTTAELNYLINLVKDNINEGSYWGNEQQFRKRQTKVFNKLSSGLLSKYSIYREEK